MASRVLACSWNERGKQVLAALTLILLLSGCAGIQARRERDEKWAQLFSLDRRLHDQYREGKITASEAASQLIESNNRLFPPQPHLEKVKVYRLRLAEQVDDGELDLATAKDLFRVQLVQAIAEANPSTPYQQIRLWRLALEVVSGLDHPRPLSDYRFYLVDKSKLNAASAGFGTFYIFSGALDLPDRQLMALLAHEIAHDALNHMLKARIVDTIMAVGVAVIGVKSPAGARIADAIRIPVFQAFSRSEEAEADAEAVRLLQRLGYSKVEMAALLQDLLTRYGNTGGFFANHPLTTDRIATVRGMPEDIAWASPRPAATSRLARGWLGIQTREVVPEEARFLQLPSNRGAVVEYVAPGSPAASGGLRRGDIVLGFGEAEIRDSVHLRQLIRKQPLGSEVNLKVYNARADNESVLSIKLGSPPN